jgi:hypothetical protein
LSPEDGGQPETALREKKKKQERTVEEKEILPEKNN